MTECKHMRYANNPYGYLAGMFEDANYCPNVGQKAVPLERGSYLIRLTDEDKPISFKQQYIGRYKFPMATGQYNQLKNTKFEERGKFWADTRDVFAISTRNRYNSFSCRKTLLEVNSDNHITVHYDNVGDRRGSPYRVNRWLPGDNWGPITLYNESVGFKIVRYNQDDYAYSEEMYYSGNNIGDVVYDKDMNILSPGISDLAWFLRAGGPAVRKYHPNIQVTTIYNGGWHHRPIGYLLKSEDHAAYDLIKDIQAFNKESNKMANFCAGRDIGLTFSSWCNRYTPEYIKNPDNKEFVFDHIRTKITLARLGGGI